MTSIVLHSKAAAPKKKVKAQKAVSVDPSEPQPICSTRILCFDKHGESVKHQILWFGDRFVCHGCQEADARSTKNAAMAALGGKAYWGEEDSGCEALMTLLKMVPYMNVGDQDDRFLGSTVKPGPFRDLYYDYESNSLFKAVQKAKKARDLMGKEHVYDAALKAAVKHADTYFDDDVTEDMIVFKWNVPTSKMNGQRVAWWPLDTWHLPIAPDWYDTVYKSCKGIIGGKFVCGISEDGVVYAVDRSGDDKMVVRPFAKRGNRLSPA